MVTKNGKTVAGVKRRGRPPRSQVVETVPKRRGRPPKASKETVKRRGRPPKNAPEEATKRRGRPPKALAQAPKRRGRPPKTAEERAKAPQYWKTMLRLPVGLAKRLKAESAKQGLSINSLLTTVIQVWLDTAT